MQSKAVILCLLAFLVLTACAQQVPGPVGPNVSQPDTIPWGPESRTGAERVTALWRRSFGDVQYFEHVLVNNPQGIMVAYVERQGKTGVFSLAVLDPETGSVLHVGRLDRVNPYCRWPNAILHEGVGEILLETDIGTTVLPQLPEAEGWFDFLLREDGVVLLGYDQTGRFITYLNRQGETLWSYRLPQRGPKEIFVLEAFGSREQLADLGNGLLGAHGLAIQGLIALDASTGEVVWDYHIPIEDRICDVSVGADGIWVAGLSYDSAGVVALLAPDGTVLREIEHPAAVMAIGALEDEGSWFMAGWGPDGRNKLYLLERDRLAKVVCEDIEFGVVPEVDNSLVFVDGSQGLLYRWLPGQDAEAYELPFYGSPNSTRVLGARDGIVIMQHKNEIYAISLED